MEPKPKQPYGRARPLVLPFLEHGLNQAHRQQDMGRGPHSSRRARSRPSPPCMAAIAQPRTEHRMEAGKGKEETAISPTSAEAKSATPPDCMGR